MLLRIEVKYDRVFMYGWSRRGAYADQLTNGIGWNSGRIMYGWGRRGAYVDQRTNGIGRNEPAVADERYKNGRVRRTK